jgi:hypothetical protein
VAEGEASQYPSTQNPIDLRLVGKETPTYSQSVSLVTLHFFRNRNIVTVHGFRGSGFTANAAAMPDLRIYGKKRLAGLFRAWLKKQIGVKARAGTPNKCRHISRVNKIRICVRRTERKITLNREL